MYINPCACVSSCLMLCIPLLQKERREHTRKIKINTKIVLYAYCEFQSEPKKETNERSEDGEINGKRYTFAILKRKRIAHTNKILNGG